MQDSWGNLIVVDAGQKNGQPKTEVPKNKVFVFTHEDVIIGLN